MRGLASPALVTRILALAQSHVGGPVGPVEYEADTQYEGAPAARAAAGGATVRRLLGAAARDPQFRDWALSAAVTEPMRQLLGPQIVVSQAHHNCVMTKQPAYSSLTGWHQDIRYWSFERSELISAWLALGPERPSNGGLMVVPGSHQLNLRRERFDEALFFKTDLDVNRELLAGAAWVELDAGDVLFFHARLLHAAGRNQTTETKYALVFTYHEAGNLPIPGTRSASLPELPVS